jgi:glyoxylase-like metal-dependent hydrolase (beta-lactamase superfamily II)
VVHAPGHADYQYVLHDEARGILFAADHVLLGITPNIGLWPESLPHPLARYLKSLAAMRSMGVNLVLPGHGPVFHDLGGRIDELLRHHEKRLEVMSGEIQDRPKTPFEVSGAVFRETLTLYERCFALAETLAHLDHLVLEGRARRVEGEALAFRAA